jgi:hypothetical protein
MKATVELPDSLFIAAKKRAAELRRPLRTLIESGLRRELERPARGQPNKRVKLRWVTVRGGLPPGVDVSDRAGMHEWLRTRR